jgi:hypothetical protein
MASVAEGAPMVRLSRPIATACTALALSCGSGASDGANCRELLRRYALALAAGAGCDPAVSSSCSAVRTTASLDPLGTPFLCVDCETHVNPASLAAIDDVMSQYRAAACSFHEQMCPTCSGLTGQPGACASNGMCQ